jgi:hypothetical protein
VKIKKYFNSESIQIFILIGIVCFFIINSFQTKKSSENFELIKILTFTIVLLSSTVTSFRILSNIHKSYKNREIGLNNNLIIIGFIAIIVLAILTDFSKITIVSIGIGIIMGVLKWIFWLIEKLGLKLWDIFKENKRKQMFDYFENRPENIKRRKSKEDN